MTFNLLGEKGWKLVISDHALERMQQYYPAIDSPVDALEIAIIGGDGHEGARFVPPFLWSEFKQFGRMPRGNNTPGTMYITSIWRDNGKVYRIVCILGFNEVAKVVTLITLWPFTGDREAFYRRYYSDRESGADSIRLPQEGQERPAYPRSWS